MISTVGHIFLILALICALLQGSFLQFSRPFSILQSVFALAAFFTLAYAFLLNFNTHLSALYRFSAVWGGHEGSLLLWTVILSLWSACVAIVNRSLPKPVLTRVLAVLGWISVGFYLLMLLNSDPFQMIAEAQKNGNDLNPILQDPGLMIHPPILYLGYVGFSVVFAFSVAALLLGEFDELWARWMRPWAQAAWSFLTLGIVLGSWWSYRELGWGGFWFWDPVENASLLPWLIATALLHVLLIVEKRNLFKTWAILLALGTFSLSLLGTFLVRSGVLISVHAFASDPKRGEFLLYFLACVIGGSLVLYAIRAKKLATDSFVALWSREGLLLMNGIGLCMIMLTVLLGTLYPLIIDALGYGKISVGAPYFNAVFFPMMIPLLLLMSIAPFFQYHDMRSKNNFFIFLFVIFIFYVAYALFHALVWIGIALAGWIVLTHIKLLFSNSPKKISMITAHIGVAVTLLGIVLSSAYTEERTVSMKLGESISAGSYQFLFRSVSGVHGADFFAAQANVEVMTHHHKIAELHPQLRAFQSQGVTLAKAGIDVGVFRDLYIALDGTEQNGDWTFLIAYKPLIRWIWCGGLLMTLSGMISIIRRLYDAKN